MDKFIKIGESLINLHYIRAVEHAGDGRLQIYLSEDRASGLVLRYSGDEAARAWQTLTDAVKIPIIDADEAAHQE